MRPVPFAEAIAWATARDVVLPEVYYGEMQGVARSVSFSVAGIAQLSQLQAVLDSLVKETAASSFGEWKAAVARGDIPLELPDYRLENIYRTNLQSHYSRGRCEQQKRVVNLFPYFMYDAVNDSRTRPSHAAMDGFVARADDPVWSVWTPPNGYMCRCRRIALTEAQAQKYLSKTQSAEAEAARRDALLNGPDPGWDYSVCADVAQGAQQAIDSLRLDPALARVAETRLTP
jgi:SPP1 gp7 family putative phage head morphogenesis protein